MTDIGDLPVTILLTAYFAAYLLRAPKWLQLSIAVPMGITSVWALAVGIHIYVAADLGRPLSKIARVVALIALIAALLYDHLELRREAGLSTTEAKD